MKQIVSENYDPNNFENDDLITFQLESKTINLYYSQLTKYSEHIRNKYLYSDVINHFPEEINTFQKKYQLSLESVVYFSQLLKQNYNIEEDSNLSYIQCIDLLKISKYLKIRKLSYQIQEYIKNHQKNVDFIIQMILYENEAQKKTKSKEYEYEEEYEINEEIENFLINRLDECLSNEKFTELPISIIYRIIEKNSTKEIDANKLFDFIKKSISKFCVCFRFLKIQQLSDENLEDLCDIYTKSEEKSRQYFSYLPCNLDFINEMIKQKKNAIKESEELKNQQQIDLKKYELQIQQLQKQLEESEKNKNKIEDEKDQLKKQLEEMANQIKGQITASVKQGLIISAKIKLILNNASLDTSRSKCIISRSCSKRIGIEAYSNGEPITSSELNTVDFICKSGTYYVRCIIFDLEGKSTEIVSNSVTTSGTSVLLEYEGKETAFLLGEGDYKFEVWGAKGGNSAGVRYNTSSSGEGGLGGYSSGIVRMRENDKIHVFVGGEGKTSVSRDGATTDGGFPDGGGTQTGFFQKYTTVPGTGGGSTSIRIGSDSEYARVIVAGGGGGASGDCYFTDHGGFGGGLNGGNCYYEGSLNSRGSGTQTGSTRGLGDKQDGDPGSFGRGATGKYEQGSSSGGGGGGGWYGGGSGGYSNGHGCNTPASSGGGGSGWTFNEASFSVWQGGDETNASKFKLESRFYLREAKTAGGNEEFPRPDGNGTEKGHSGNGYAKITPQ